MPIDPVFESWRPEGRTLAVEDSFPLIDVTDGDTPGIRMPIRMLSVDTPEVTARRPSRAREWDRRLERLADWIEAGLAPIEPGLAASLLPRLRGGAGTLQYEQGLEASAFLKDRVAARLRSPGGGMRKLFIRTADLPFDGNNRLLAYVAPNYTEAEREEIPPGRRPTFNLELVASGWASPFVIYPSLPKAADLRLLVEAAERAVAEGRGAWGEPRSLPGYEYRMAEKLYFVTERLVAGEAGVDARGWRSRYCADMGTRQLFGPEAYMGVPHHRRLWIWPDDLEEARERLDLVDA